MASPNRDSYTVYDRWRPWDRSVVHATGCSHDRCTSCASGSAVAPAVQRVETGRTHSRSSSSRSRSAPRAREARARAATCSCSPRKRAAAPAGVGQAVAGTRARSGPTASGTPNTSAGPPDASQSKCGCWPAGRGRSCMRLVLLGFQMWAASDSGA
eukprot:1353903-Prymnesium_polylepis.1